MVKLQCQRSRFVTDERSRLTWKGLFRDVDNTVNFYSTRDEVVANGDGSWKWPLTRKFAWYSPYAELYGEGGGAFLQANPYVLWYALSHGIPAESFAAGANPVPKWDNFSEQQQNHWISRCVRCRGVAVDGIAEKVV